MLVQLQKGLYITDVSMRYGFTDSTAVAHDFATLDGARQVVESVIDCFPRACVIEQQMKMVKLYPARPPRIRKTIDEKIVQKVYRDNGNSTYEAIKEVRRQIGTNQMTLAECKQWVEDRRNYWDTY